MHVATHVQEVGDPVRHVAADVADHLDFPAIELAGNDVGKEGRERFAGVTDYRLARHLAGGVVARRELDERTAAFVLEVVALGEPWR